MGGGGGGGVAEASESDAGVTIHIRCSNGSKFSVQITLVSTVGSFKSVLAHNCDIPAEHQRLIYKGRILKDDQTLQSYAGGAQTNSTTRSNPAGDTRLPAPGAVGLGGLGLPEFERMFGSMQGTASLSQFMQNPAMSQMMQNLLSNSQYMNQILALNPQLRNMLNSNPQFREMMQNPDFIRQLMSPETMQQLLTLQQTLLSQVGRQPPTREVSQTVGGRDNMGLEMLMNMFGGLGTGSPTIPNRLNVPPEEQYATQLSQLQEMGFFDTQENIRALIATAGNVHAAVERLLGNPGL